MKEERKQLDQISEYLEKVGSSENKLEDSALFFEYLDYDFSLISMGEIMTLSVLNSCKCNENGYLKESVLDEVGALVSCLLKKNHYVHMICINQDMMRFVGMVNLEKEFSLLLNGVKRKQE